MAETIVLNGVFKDDITPQLKKLTRSIEQLQKSFAKFGKSLRPIARDLGKVAAASERINMALKDQSKQTINASKAWAVYRREVGKAGAAQRKAFGGVAAGPRGPRASGGGGARGLGGAVAGAGIGMALGRVVEQGIITGFRIGAQIMMKPFQYLAGAIGERIKDELDDIMSAGGLFANDRRYGTNLFSGFGAARGFQEDLNRRLAESAAALPGATNDYVRAARQITDTIGIAFGKDKDAFNTFAKELGGTGESLDSIATVLQNFTEKAVMLGQAGGGGMRGTMGLPMLLEQMVNQEQVNIPGLKRRYAALRTNPLLASALEDAQEEINAAGANTAARLKAVMKALDEALPDEVVAAMKTSMSGVLEAVRSSFLDPDTGLFGLGRLLKTTVPKVDALGRFVDKNNKVVASAAEAVEEQTTLYKMFREVVGGFMIPLSELTNLLPTLFDPLSKIADEFVELREISQEFYRNFNAYTEWFKQNEFKDAGARGAMSALNKFLKDLGVIGFDEASANIQNIKNKDFTLADLFKNMMTQLLESDFMEKIGHAIGRAVGQIIASVAAVMNKTKDAAKSGLGKGLIEGFQSAGGTAAVKSIFKRVFELMLELLWLAIREAPGEMLLVGGAIALGPIIGGLITSAITGGLGPALTVIGGWIKMTVWPLIAPFALIAAKVMLIVGAVMGLLAIIRHADLIFKGLVIMLEYFGHAVGWVTAKLSVGILDFLSKIGMASKDEVAKARAEAEKHAIGMQEKRQELEANTAESLARTASDFESITSGFKTLMGGGAQPESGGSNVQQAPLTRATTQALNTSSAVSNIDKAIKKVGEVVRKQNELNRAKFTTMNTALVGMNNKLNGVLSVEIVKSVPLPMNIQMGGGATGNEQGGPSVFNNLAGAMGLMMTSGYRPNDTDSYHGINRARDYAGDPQQMLAFAQMMSSTFGGTLKELIYTPLGYSIKNGQVVPPYAQGTHYDHVHVAYGMGGGSPAFFSSKSAAQSWERRVAPSNSAIASVTSNSAEMGGGSVTVGSINISGVNDPQAIAETVAEEIMMALDRSSYTSLYNS